MRRKGKLISGMLVGAGAMYLLDPDRGARRRTLLREKGPASRFAVGTIGGLVTLKGTRTRGMSGQLLTALGSGLLARAAGRVPVRRLVELGVGHRGFVVEKTLLVDVPLAQAWELWSTFENFPRFMAHLKEVRKIDERRSHWVAVGPVGLPVEWDAITTDWVPGQFVGWTSVEGSTVETSGQVRLRPVSQNQTQIDVQLSYRPPAGAAGHALASILGVDPKQAMDEDLLRLKSLLEEKSTSTPDGAVSLEEVMAGDKPTGRKRASRKKT